MSLLRRLRCLTMSTVSIKRTNTVTKIIASDIHKAGLLDARFDDDCVLGTGKEKQNHSSLTWANCHYAKFWLEVKWEGSLRVSSVWRVAGPTQIYRTILPNRFIATLFLSMKKGKSHWFSPGVIGKCRFAYIFIGKSHWSLTGRSGIMKCTLWAYATQSNRQNNN